MTNTLILHYAPDNASLCVRLALEQLGMPYETSLVDRSRQAQHDPDYLALNPNGLIPTLETPDGVIFETAAILLWLADRQPGVAFPAPGAPARGQALTQLFWLSNTLHPLLRMLFYPESFAGDRAFDTQTRKTLTDKLTILDQSDLRWLDRDGPAIMGCYLAPMLRWCGLYGGNTDWFRLATYRNLYAFAARFETTSAMQAAIAAEGLGPAPLTAPQTPNPPEGTAL